MKSNLVLLVSLLYLLPLGARADEAPEILLRGILKLNGNQAFSISDTAGHESKWLRIGQSFADYTLTSFEEATEVLTVQKGDQQFELSIAGSETPLEPSGDFGERLAEAQRIMDLMQFDKMMEDTMAAQMDGMGDMMRQQMSQMGQSVDEAFVDFYSQAMTRMFDGIDWQPIKEGMSAAYAEIFTKSELQGMANFYSTPAGQATLKKTPEIQQKTMQVMMPAILQGSRKLQKELGEFMQKREQPED